MRGALMGIVTDLLKANMIHDIILERILSDNPNINGDVRKEWLRSSTIIKQAREDLGELTSVSGKK
jgi:hypothetical protein